MIIYLSGTPIQDHLVTNLNNEFSACVFKWEPHILLLSCDVPIGRSYSSTLQKIESLSGTLGPVFRCYLFFITPLIHTKKNDALKQNLIKCHKIRML